MGRMTKTSRANLEIADACGVVAGASGWMVWVERNGARAYLSDSAGPLEYKTDTLARRAVKRIRPDLEPTTI